MATQIVLPAKEKLSLLNATQWIQTNGQRELYCPPDFTTVTEADAKVATAKSVSRLLSKQNVDTGLRLLAQEKLLIRYPDRFRYGPNDGQKVGVYQIGKAGKGYLVGFREGQEAAALEQKPTPPVSPGHQPPSWLKFDVLRVDEARTKKNWVFDCFWGEPNLTLWTEGTGITDLWTLVVRAVRQSGTFNHPLGTSCHCGWVLATFKTSKGFFISCKQCGLWVAARGCKDKGASIMVDI